MSSSASRKVLLFQPAKALLPLQKHLTAQGLIMEPIAEGLAKYAPNEILGCFVCFYDSLRHPLRAARRHRRLHALGVPVVAWNRDAPHYLNKPGWRLKVLEILRPFDVYLTHSQIDGRRFGERNLYFANAAEPSVYGLSEEGEKALVRLRDSAQYEWDVSFLGSMNGDRFKEMKPRQIFFAALAERLSASGIRFLFQEAECMDVAQQRSIIQRSRINLNFGAACDYGSAMPSGMPERCFGIPAAGGFLLCDRRTHARDDFVPGEDWAEFDGLDDCVAKIHYWLDHFEQARALAERCHARVMADHTYAKRAVRLRQILLAWHGYDEGNSIV